MNAHPAGPLHAGVQTPAETAGPRPSTRPSWTSWPPRSGREAPAAATPARWSWPGSTCATSPRSTARRCSSSTRPTSGPARPSSPPRSVRSRCTTRPRRSSAPRSPAGSPTRGSRLDVCSGGELAVALRAGFPAERIAFHGNNKSDGRAGRGGRGRGRARGARLVPRDRPARRRRPRARVVGAGDDPADRRGRGAHARVHRHRARGPEVRLLDRGRSRPATPPRPSRRVLKADALALVGLHSHIGSQIFDTEGFEVAAHRVVAVPGAAAPRARVATRSPRCAPSTSAAASASPTGRTRPRSTSPQLAAELRGDRRARVRTRPSCPRPRSRSSPGRAIAGPGTVTLYEVGTLKDVPLGGGHRAATSAWTAA